MNAMRVYLLLFLVLLSACAQLAKQTGFEEANTVPKRLAYTYAGITEARADAEKLLKAKRITAPDARKVQVMCDVALESTNQARAAYFNVGNSDHAKALNMLQAAESVLTEATNLLRNNQLRP